jgi:hypothetical protein
MANKDDDDPWFAVTGTDMLDNMKGQRLKGEKRVAGSVKFGDTYWKYTSTPLAGLLAGMGEIMDEYRFDKDDDGRFLRDTKSDEYWLGRVAVWFAVAPALVFSSSVYPIVNDAIKDLAEGFYGLSETKFDKELGKKVVANLDKIFLPISGLTTTPWINDLMDLYRGVLGEPNMDGDKLWKGVAKRTLFEWFFVDNTMPITDVFGDIIPASPISPLSGLVQAKELPPWAEFNNRLAPAITEPSPLVELNLILKSPG